MICVFLDIVHMYTVIGPFMVSLHCKLDNESISSGNRT